MKMPEAPPGILDLIPWKPSPSSDGGSNATHCQSERAVVVYHEDAFDLKPHLWSHLPEHLLHSVLARLPFQSVLRFRCVCMQWKALFGSPTFHHLASHRTHIPPWIFFLASSNRLWKTSFQYDDGHDDNGYVFEEDAHGEIHDEDDEQRDSHVVNASDDPRDAHDVVRHGDYGEMHDAVICGDHGGDMHDVTRCGDHGDTHGADDNANANVREGLFLIFDCESESWHAPLAIPPGFKAQIFLNSDDACSFQEHVLIPAERTRIFLFNPASPSCRELPPCIYIQKLQGLGLSEERAMLSSSGTSTNLSNLSSSIENRQGTMAKFLQVVAVEAYDEDTYVVESFNFMTGSWRICGYFQQSDDTMFRQTRMVFCKGSFYARVVSGILRINSLSVGQNMEYTLRYFPSVRNRDGDEDRVLIESCLIATKSAVFLVGVTYTQSQEDWDVVIWEFHPDAPEEACWQLVAYTPKSILNDFYGGGIHILCIDCRAHGDLIFFQVPNRQRFLIYDVSHKLWRFSAKCKYFLFSMTFVWEPLLRN